MQRLFRRSTPIILSGLLALFGAAACGDDDGGDGGASDQGDDGDDGDGQDDDGGDGPDAGTPDADVPEVVRQGTVAITETSVSNTGGLFSGAVVSISYVDLESVTVPPVEGFENGIGFCAVTVYDVAAGETEPTLVDEGPITVTGTANGDFVCGFNAEQGYLCQSTDAVAAGGVAGNAAGASWDGDDAQQRAEINSLSFNPNASAFVGSQILLDGFGDKALDGQTFGVLDVPLNNQIALATQGPVPDTIPTLPKTATFTTFIGAGPIRNDEGYNFISDKSEVVVSAEASESGLVPAFSGTYTPEAEGFALVDDAEAGNFLPHQIPTTDIPKTGVSFACAADGCGTAGAGGTTGAMIINGRTTDGALPPADVDPAGIAMPDPVASFATFQCAFPGADAALIRAEELAAILDTSPTRIQTTVLRAQATLNATGGSETAETRIIIGHSQTGFTTVEAPPKLARPTK